MLLTIFFVDNRQFFIVDVVNLYYV